MNTITITTRWTGAVLWTGDASGMRDAMEQACRSGADLGGAYLRDVYLPGADLRSANLRGADLTGANLRGADLGNAYLTGADLRDANLRGANLGNADLRSTDLTGADPTGAYLTGANLGGATNANLAIARTRILPEGRLIGWKKCSGGVIVKLAIPENAKRSHAFGRKCRAEFVEVLEIIGATEARSHTRDYPSVTYRVGETVKPLNGWGEDWREECAPGIHLFITRAEAEAY